MKRNINHIITTLLVALFLLPLTSANAQADISNASFKIGMIRNYQTAIGENAYNAFTLLPEFEFGGKFFLNNIRWGIGIGYWHNEVNPNIFRDYFPNNYKSVIITPKFYYSFSGSSSLPENFDLSVIAGISYQNVIVTPLFNQDIFGNPLKEESKNIFEPVLGTLLDYSFTNNFSTAFEFLFHIMNRNESDINQIELKFVVSYDFTR